MSVMTPNIRRAARAALLISLVLIGACGIPFRSKDRHPYPKKTVTAKEGVSVLVAGSARCLVSTKEFTKVKVGDQYECNWRDSGPAVPPM
jgi:hypothetical protein